MKKAIYPGSFDPITNGHIDVLKKALNVFDEVIVLVAENPNKKSRFSTNDRVEMIKKATKNIKGVKVDYTDGLTVDYANKVGTKNLIRGLRNSTDYNYESALSKEYRKLDPTIVMCFFMASEESESISSSKIEELYHSKKDIKNLVPDSVVEMYKKR